MTYTRTTVTLVEQETFDRGLKRFRQSMAFLFTTEQVRFRKPTTVTLTYEDVHNDVERVIASVATTYTDQSCPNLHFDEIVAECRAKTAKLVNDGWLTRAKTRGEFFRVFATSIKNHVRSLVLKFRYTEKRTGVKPPPRRKREDVLNGTADSHEHRKNVEVSLDDPDSGLQVQDEHHQDERTATEMVEDYMRLLTPVEQLVFGQMTEPSVLTLLLAHADAHESGGSKARVKVKTRHLAEGVGMSEDQFENTVLTIRDKIKTYRTMSEDQLEAEARFNAAVNTLATIFNVQVPKSQFVDRTLIRRLFTIAARAEYTKVNADTAGLLEEVGAMVPKFVGQHKDCFGWHDPKTEHCNQCGVATACATKSASVGLDGMRPSPKCIGHVTRIPVVIPRMVEAPGGLKARAVAAQKSASSATNVIEPVPAYSDILSYLREVFEEHTETKNGESIVYAGIKQEKQFNLRRIFCVESADPLTLRFCGTPHIGLCQKLKKTGKNYYLPLNLTTDEAIALIDEHTKDVLKRYGKGITANA